MTRRFLPWVAAAFTVAWCFFIWHFSFESGATSAETSGDLLASLNGFFEGLGIEFRLGSRFLRKTAHFSEFFVLGVLSALTLFAFHFPHIFLPSVLFCFSVAAVDELIQVFMEGRAAALLDALLDTAGGSAGALAFLAVWLLLALHRKRKKEKKENI